MLKNEKQFWGWWTDSMKSWFEGKFEALASAMPKEATEQDIDSIFTPSNS